MKNNIKDKLLIKAGVLYGMGYVIGKHNLPDIPNKQRLKIATDYAKEVLGHISNVVDTSICAHNGCKRKSTCGDYCGQHCNCKKNKKK